MSTTGNENLPGDRGPTAPAIIGQVLGLGLALILFWLHSGGDFSHLWSPLDVGYLLALGCWLAALVLLAVWVPRRAQTRFYQEFWLSLSPAVIGVTAACVYSGLVPTLPDGRGNCDLILANAFWAERLRFVGLLATGSMWWGALVTRFLASPRPPADGPEAGSESLRWPWIVAALLFVGSAFWTFLDPIMPSRAKVGGPEVRGLWVLVAGAVVLWAWARFMSMLSTGQARLRALWGGMAACLGLLMVGSALVAYHRFTAFHGLAHEAARFLWADNDAGAVTATALLRISPFLLAAMLAALVIGLRRVDKLNLRRSLALVVALLAGTGLYLGYEAGWRSMYAEQCGSVLPPKLDLPSALSFEEPREGSLLVVDRDNAWLDGNHVIEMDPLELKPGRAAMRGEPLSLAVDRRVKFFRLHGFLKAAGMLGWHRFRLLVRDPAVAGCERERRLFGVCLSEHISNLSASSFEIPHLTRQSTKPAAPPDGVVANVIVESDRMEVSFGGFGVSGEVMDSMAAQLPNRMGVRNLASLVQVLTRAKERFPASSRLILVVHDDLPVDELAVLATAVRGDNTPSLFPDLTVSRLVR